MNGTSPGLTLHEEVRSPICRLTPLAYDVIQAQIQLVECQILTHHQPHLQTLQVFPYLLGVDKRFASRILIRIRVINLKRSIQRIVVTLQPSATVHRAAAPLHGRSTAHLVHCNQMRHKRMVLVRLEG